MGSGSTTLNFSPPCSFVPFLSSKLKLFLTHLYQALKFCDLAITVNNYRNLDLAVKIANITQAVPKTVKK